MSTVLNKDPNNQPANTQNHTATNLATNNQATTVRKGGLSEFIMVAILAITGVVLLMGNVTVEIIGDTTPGPMFMPNIVGVLALILAVVLAIDILAKPKKGHDAIHSDDPDISPDLLEDLGDIDPHATDTPTPGLADWKCTAAAVVGFAALILLLPYLGWVITAGLLFFMVSVTLGGKNYVRDLAIGFIISSLTYLAFAVGLGLNLPSGLIGGII